MIDTADSIRPESSDFSEPLALHDVIIVGAGPSGLAIAARLREATPAAIFTDEEHRRYHWLRQHHRGLSLKHVKSGRVSQRPGTPASDLDVVVLDAEHDQWLGRWDRLFSTFEIQHLRSPMFWHLDPKDRDSLLAYTYEQDRPSELLAIPHCVGKEISKHIRKKRQRRQGSELAPIEINERDRNDYFTPSASLFYDHCRIVAEQYGLTDNLVQKASVLDISYGTCADMLYSDEKLFTVTTSKGIRYARTVVLAVGPGNQPKVPGFLLTACGAGNELPQACHSMQIKCFPDYTVQKKIKEGRETNILVVGGGLTSAQLSDLAVRKGVTRVWHVMRGSCRVKPFDLDLDWMSKYRNFQQACFWSADSDEERLQMIQRARNGGSITSFFDKKLKEHCASGRLKLMTNTLVVNAVFGPALEQAGPGGLWTVKTDPQVSDLPPMDYIYFATGIQTDFTQLNYLQTMQKTYPITEVGGFPCLDDRLRWRNDVPLFVTGKMAALKLGPGAGNLGGAKFGAERISLALADLLLRNRSEGRDTRSNEEKAKHKDGSVSYCTGLGSKYTCLNASLPV